MIQILNKIYIKNVFEIKKMFIFIFYLLYKANIVKIVDELPEIKDHNDHEINSRNKNILNVYKIDTSQMDELPIYGKNGNAQVHETQDSKKIQNTETSQNSIVQKLETLEDKKLNTSIIGHHHSSPNVYHLVPKKEDGLHYYYPKKQEKKEDSSEKFDILQLPFPDSIYHPKGVIIKMDDDNFLQAENNPDNKNKEIFDCTDCKLPLNNLPINQVAKFTEFINNMRNTYASSQPYNNPDFEKQRDLLVQRFEKLKDYFNTNKNELENENTNSLKFNKNLNDKINGKDECDCDSVNNKPGKHDKSSCCDEYPCKNCILIKNSENCDVGVHENENGGIIYRKNANNEVEIQHILLKNKDRETLVTVSRHNINGVKYKTYKFSE